MERGAESGEQLRVATTTRLPHIDPLLADSGSEPDFFWEDPARGLSAAGFGIAAEAPFEQVGDVGLTADHADIPGPWFGGIAFNRKRHLAQGAWEGFPASRFLLPRVLVWRAQQGAFMTRWARPNEETVVDIRLAAAWAGGPPKVESVVSDREGWDRVLTAFLNAIARGEVSKIVAARELHVRLDSAVNLRALMHRLRAGAGSSATVFMMRAGDSCFLGATPERLCWARDGRLRTEALASSAAPSQQDALGRSDKDVREHQAVIDGLKAALTPLADAVSVDDGTKALHLPYVTHLRTPLSARLRPHVRPLQIVDAIFPTAAVGGTPRERALALIAEHEGWARGWYAGAIGWASKDALDLKVGIRSALVRGCEARLFVGAGIVAGSDPQREWEETELKAKPMLAAFGVEGGADGWR